MNRKTFLLGMLSLTACTNDIEQPDLTGIMMTAEDFMTEKSSRTSFDITPNGAEFTWAENDTVGIFPTQGSQVYFPMLQGAGTKTANFTGGGWALKPSARYAAYYPYHVLNQQITAVPISYEGQTQLGNGSTEHLGKHDFMAAVASTPSYGNVHFKFQHLGALVELNLTKPRAGQVTMVKLIAEEPVFNVRGTLDLTEENLEITPTQKSPYLSVNLKDVQTEADHQTIKVYFMVPPTKLLGKSLKAEITDAEGNVQEVQLQSKNFEAGKAYRLGAELSDTRVIRNVFHVQDAGSLKWRVGSRKDTITEMKVIGPLNGDDIRFIREMGGKDFKGGDTQGQLKVLDLSDATIVSGGSSYYVDATVPLYTSENWIDRMMFQSCNFTEIIVPKSTVHIGTGAFEYCKSLKRVTLPSSVKTIGVWAFNECPKLEFVNLPEGIETIEWLCFENCYSLKSLVLPNSVKEIGEEAFYGCHSLTNINLPDGITTIKDKAFTYCYSLTRMTLPNSITNFGRDVFSDCEKLERVNIPESITTLQGTFSGCKSLKTIKIPESVENIHSAFSYCESLESIDIPEGVYDIDYAFQGCRSLKTIKIPQRVNTINGTFGGCSNLESIDIPSHINSIDYAFWGCEKLTSIVIPKNVTKIGRSAFRGCTGLTSIEIPNGVESIEETAFENCTGLTDLVIPYGVTSLGYNAFAGCTNLVSVTLPNSVTTFNASFSGCTHLQHINLPNGLKYTGNSTFFNCKELTSIVLPNGLEGIGAGTFQSAGLTSIQLPSTTMFIGPGAFCNCTNLKYLQIPPSVSKIFEAAFAINLRDTANPPSIRIQARMTTIDQQIFTNKFVPNETYYFDEVYLPSSLESIGADVITSCVSINKLYLFSPQVLTLDNRNYLAYVNEIYVPQDLVYAYKSAYNWSTYANKIYPIPAEIRE